MGEQVYVADNLAFFPFQVQDEPLFVIHQIDIIVSVAGSNLMQSFKEVSSSFFLHPFLFSFFTMATSRDTSGVVV